MNPAATPDSQSAERETLAKAREAVGNPLYDHEYATRNLLEAVQQGLARRADRLAAEFHRVHLKLSIHVDRTIAAKDAVIDPRFRELSDLMEKADSLMTELEFDVKAAGDPNTKPAIRKKLMRKTKRRLDEVSQIEKQMQTAFEPVGTTLKDMEAEVAIAAQMWASIRGAARVSARLGFLLLGARLQASIVRVLFVGVALALAVLIDRQTSIAEAAMPSFAWVSKHDVAVAFLFILQTALYEPVSVKLKKYLSSTVFAGLLRRAEILLVRVEEYEHQLERARSTMEELKRRVP